MINIWKWLFSPRCTFCNHGYSCSRLVLAYDDREKIPLTVRQVHFPRAWTQEMMDNAVTVHVCDKKSCEALIPLVRQLSSEGRLVGVKMEDLRSVIMENLTEK